MFFYFRHLKNLYFWTVLHVDNKIFSLKYLQQRTFMGFFFLWVMIWQFLKKFFPSQVDLFHWVFKKPHQNLFKIFSQIAKHTCIFIELWNRQNLSYFFTGWHTRARLCYFKRHQQVHMCRGYSREGKQCSMCAA